MASCIRHGVKALLLDRRRVIDDRSSGAVPVMVDVIQCPLCASEDGDDGVRKIEAEDKGHYERRYVKATRFPGPVRHGRKPVLSHGKRKHYRGRTGGEIRISAATANE